MPDIDVLTQILPPIGAAAAAYGAAVLTRSEDTAAEKTVRLGQRLLAKILRREDPDSAKDAKVSVDGVKRAVLDLAAATAEEMADAQAALRLELRRLLAADPQLRDELAELLPPVDVPVPGSTTVSIAGDVSGIVSTGDRNVNIQAN